MAGEERPLHDMGGDIGPVDAAGQLVADETHREREAAATGDPTGLSAEERATHIVRVVNRDQLLDAVRKASRRLRAPPDRP